MLDPDQGAWLTAPAEIRVCDQGRRPMSRRRGPGKLGGMPRFLIEHRHEPHECGVVFAAFSRYVYILQRWPHLRDSCITYCAGLTKYKCSALSKGLLSSLTMRYSRLNRTGLMHGVTRELYA